MVATSPLATPTHYGRSADGPQGGLGDLSYHDSIRRDIAPLLPAKLDSVIEVGCGTGATLAWLKRDFKASEVLGIEQEPAAAAVARSCLDRLIEGDLTGMDLENGVGTGGIRLPAGSQDLVLALDILEHLADPWTAVRRLSRLVAAGGAFIASLPNAAHFSVSLGLLRGRWRYADWGILDRTHLRFFVEATAVELVECGGLAVDRGVFLGLEPGRRTRLADRLTGGRLRHLLAHGFVLRATPGGPGGGPIRWTCHGDAGGR
jgi:SAM-dependent methyltransferase